MTILTKDAVSEALHKAVAEKGEDYVYPRANEGCRYADPYNPEVPSCIVGHVVAALDPETFKRIGQREEENEMSFSATYLLDDGPFGLDPEDDSVVAALQVAQSLQDLGLPWGYAQEGFDRVIKGEEYIMVEGEITSRWHAETQQD